MRKPTTTLRSLFLLISSSFLPGCNCGGGGSHFAGGAAIAHPPSVQITEPNDVQTATIGGVVTIKYIDSEDLVVAKTDITIVSSNGKKTSLAKGVPEADGVEHTVLWNTAGFAADDYHVEARTSDGKHSVKATSPNITLKTPVGGGPPAGNGFAGSSGDASGFGRAIATFPDGSYVVTGTFEVNGGANSITLGKGEPTETTFQVTGINLFEGYLARYNADGTLAWARGTSTSIGGGSVGITFMENVATLDDGSIVCTGETTTGAQGAQVILSFGKPDATTLVFPAQNQNAPEVFVARYDAGGALLWARQIENIATSQGLSVPGATAIASDPGAGKAAACVVIGQFSGNVKINSGQPSEAMLNAPGSSSQVFLARFENDGSVGFVKTIVPVVAGGVDALSISAFPDRTFSVSGKRLSAIELGAGEANDTVINSGSLMFFARYNSDGTLAWARNAAGAGIAEQASVAACGDGSTAVAGVLGSNNPSGDNITLGQGDPNETTLAIANNEVTIFIARYDGAGKLVYARKAAGDLLQGKPGNRLAGFADGSFALCGILNNAETGIFGAGDPNQTTLTANNEGGWVARYAPDGKLQWVRGGGGQLFGGDLAFAEFVSVAAFQDGRTAMIGHQIIGPNKSVTYEIGEANPILAPSGGSSFTVATLRIAQ
ncbi:MAG: hypothetical protein HY286_09410 [Planctomycetes bacterium]|nr:hypothetical protein [Planctomycetota bacterium]